MSLVQVVEQRLCSEMPFVGQLRMRRWGEEVRPKWWKVRKLWG